MSEPTICTTCLRLREGLCDGEKGQTACAWYKRMTNGDRVRAMTDEELDKFLGEVQCDVVYYCDGVTQKQEYPVPEQRGAWLGWLKQEVSDNG